MIAYVPYKSRLSLSQEGGAKEKTEEVLVQPIGTGTIATTDTGKN